MLTVGLSWSGPQPATSTSVSQYERSGLCGSSPSPLQGLVMLGLWIQHFPYKGSAPGEPSIFVRIRIHIIDCTNPILHPIFFTLHLMMLPQNYYPGPPTPPVEESKQEFTPMIVSPVISIQTSDIYNLLISFSDVLSNLQLDVNGEVLDSEKMKEDAMENEDLR